MAGYKITRWCRDRYAVSNSASLRSVDATQAKNCLSRTSSSRLTCSRTQHAKAIQAPGSQVSQETTVSLTTRERRQSSSDRGTSKNTESFSTSIVEQFPAHMRATSAAIAYNVAISSADVPSFLSRLSGG